MTLLLLWAPLAWSAGSSSCAPCHPAIYESYRRTPMAMSSGRLDGSESLARAAFSHSASGFRYQVSKTEQRYFLDFSHTSDANLRGRKELSWFIGSGAAARGYLIVADGFLFQAPVSYYSAGARWDLAPAYEKYAYPYLTRPVQPGCLSCHASFLNTVPGKQNRYRTPPFAEAGIACERCHGAGESHIENMKAGRASKGVSIVNPAKLAAERRDSVCAQCHLSGEVRVMRPGANWQSFRPGDLLSDSITVFIRGVATQGMTVTSHVENLAQSTCKRTAGDKLWCGSCHDPHSLPKSTERIAWFRNKCLACHGRNDCRETAGRRAAAQDDCTRCHMPKSGVTDAQHVVYTDHSIPRRSKRSASVSAANAELIPFAPGQASSRDTALAYAIAAQRQPGGANQERVLRLLEAAEKNFPDDVEVLLYLAEAYRNGGRDEHALPLYRRTMQLDAAQVTASVGLGAILFQRGQFSEAIPLWEDALAKNAGLELVRTNLAMAQWRNGDPRQARLTLEKAVELSPGFKPAAELLERLRTLR